MKRTIEGDSAQRIFEAAVEVFAEVGYAGARVDEIAKRAGINKATIYYHIGGKKDLYNFVLRQMLEKVAARIIQKVQDASTPEEKLRQYIHTLAENIDRNPAIAPIMLREVALSGEHLSPDFIRTLLRLLTTLVDIFDEGEQQGIFVSTPPLIVHFMIMGAILFFKVRGALIARHTPLTEALKLAEHQFAGQATEEVEQLLMRTFTVLSKETSTYNITEQIERLILRAVMK